ncbi:MAG: UDP-N-acetylglucosamine 2-epimerase (non-hydrolyzing) [Thermodesulfovibrionales bacterium]|nr:UDP-N-acetylglucosamine 2-epimerase (non-hydrolyzing) [Thermodesulfovibrionales bacterium]
MTIFGTRPEAIKLAPVIKELERHSKKFKTIVCVTAQHREMLDQVLRIFDIRPDYDLDIMKSNQSLSHITSRCLLGLEHILKKEKPDMVLVQGDTTTTFAASLSAFYQQIPVGHIEAGLRTNHKYQPFPEEINRRLTTHIADLHFAPTEKAKQNLLKEGIDTKKIYVTGNTVIDALLIIKNKLSSQKAQKRWNNYFKKQFNISFKKEGKVILVTGHRRENFGKGFKSICMALKEVAEKRRDLTIVYPVHLNPNVQKPVKSILNGYPNVHLIEPLEYEPFIFLASSSYIVLTDSGGIQEEAPSMGKPVLVMRDTTERIEGIEAGTAKLVGTIRDTIVKSVIELLDNKVVYDKMSKAVNPYGDGEAAKKIFKIITKLKQMQ